MIKKNIIVFIITLTSFFSILASAQNIMPHISERKQLLLQLNRYSQENNDLSKACGMMLSNVTYQIGNIGGMPRETIFGKTFIYVANQKKIFHFMITSDGEKLFGFWLFAKIPGQTKLITTGMFDREEKFKPHEKFTLSRTDITNDEFVIGRHVTINAKKILADIQTMFNVSTMQDLKDIITYQKDQKSKKYKV